MNILIESLLKNVFARPNENVTQNSTGLPPGKRSGICYNYYLNSDYKNDPLIHSFLRKKIAKDISFSEGKNFLDSLESHTIPHIMASKALSWRDDRSLYDVIKKEEVDLLEETFLRLKDDFRRNKRYIFPLYRFLGSEFTGNNFSILSTTSLNDIIQRAISEYPYYSKIERWLEIPARSAERAYERMEAICGSFSLTLNDAQRYQFTMATQVSGHVDETGCFHSFPLRVLPSLSMDIEVDVEDIKWLKNIDKVIGNERANSKFIQAIRFFFLSWFATSQERFALNCMALDALVPRKLESMKNKCEWIRSSSSVDIDLNSVELLFKKIRSSIIHGSSASLPLCPEYPTFVSTYRVEALSALDALTADVLRKQIFSSSMSERISPLEKDPEIKSAAERIFGADNLSKIKLRSNPLNSLSEGYPSTWEKDGQPSSITQRIRNFLNLRSS